MVNFEPKSKISLYVYFSYINYMESIPLIVRKLGIDQVMNYKMH